jgi:putative ABC transport system substrate-binding protein
MRRREFLPMLGAAAAWPMAARAERSDMPVIGFLRSTPAAPFTHVVATFREGLKEQGFVEGTNVAIEYRFADNRLERLPGLAAELVRRKVAVIVGNSQAAEAAKAATTTIPIVFVTGDDPITRGLVTSLSRPGGNATGLTFFGGGKLAAKRLELLQEIAPDAAIVAVLMDPSWPGSKAELPDLEATARASGRKLVVLNASSDRDFEPAFAAMVKAGARALMVSGSPFFTSQRRTLVARVAQHRLPAIYDLRDHVEAGGLMSYSGSLADAYRQAGVYAGRILKGAKPADLPVLQPAKFELAVNLRTAKALGVTVPQSILVRADVVIE